MKNLLNKFGNVQQVSFYENGSKFSFRYELAFDGNLYSEKKDILDDNCVEFDNEVSEAILSNLDADSLFLNNDYRFFFDRESHSIKLLSDNEKFIYVINVADLKEIKKLEWSDLINDLKQ